VGEWDEDALAIELSELRELDSICPCRARHAQIDKFLSTPDDDDANAAPPLPEVAISRLGVSGSVESTACYVATQPTPTRWRECVARWRRW